jgi:hypothetical protein
MRHDADAKDRFKQRAYLINNEHIHAHTAKMDIAAPAKYIAILTPATTHDAARLLPVSVLPEHDILSFFIEICVATDECGPNDAKGNTCVWSYRY